MARVALTPTNLLGTAGLVLPATGAQTLATFTGVSFTNNGLMFLYIVVGSSGAGNLTQNFGPTTEGSVTAPVVKALANSTNYLLGPWSPTDFTAPDGTGLTYLDFSVVTGNSVTLYQLVPAT
jgi:hypothetical protein